MISIIVPVYNVEEYIDKCIRSLLQQTYSDIEILLINDGPTDNSYEICQKWQQRDSRIKVIYKENGGVGSARNMGLDIATGEYIFFVDADDWLEPSCLEEMLAKMSSNIDMVICDYREIKDNNFNLQSDSKHKSAEEVLSKSDIIKDLSETFYYPRVIWGKLYRHKLWEDVRFNSMSYSEDTYALIQIIGKIRAAYIINKPFYNYLLRGKSASHQLKIEQYINCLDTYLFAFRTALESYPEYSDNFAREYIGMAYILLKIYAKKKSHVKAIEVINKMKYVYNSGNIQSPEFSHKILILPSFIIYLLIHIKIKQTSDI